MSRTEITQNSSSLDGGGIYYYAPETYCGQSLSIHITGSTIANNHSAKNGGGLYVYSEYGRFNQLSGTLTENSADLSGGGLYIRTGDYHRSSEAFDVKYLDISHNTAGEQGGGLYSDGMIEAMYSEFHHNEAGFEGGAIYMKNN